MFTITFNGLNEAIERLSRSPSGLDRAIRSAVRRTLRGGKKDAGTKVKQRYTIKAGEVIRTIRLKQSGFSGSMTSSGSRNPLKKFMIRPRSRPRKMPAGGVFAMNVIGQGGQIRRAFLMRSGNVFERVGRSRYPIKPITGPAAPGMLSSPPVSSFIVAHMSQRLAINLDHELAFFLG